ncbi:poly-gamma-glutamate synthase PgsB [Lentibacillus sp. L22]|uniref:poly-gamma-glutamate synthase PgsB n=1 Tax=Lentibacillus TaxID=175304 RepID=UPI0022B0D8A5|nr:poly-gamma-glutamate synthase PgsB [Lentibacillus daqui]
MYLVVLLSLVLFIIGVYEKRNHQKNIEAVPIRINVNGIRGKSTVTRLITWALMEDGYHTVGKTTGTSARMIYWNRDQEEPIKRRPEGPNIREQKKVVKLAADAGANALVSECMAVNPDYQKTFQNKMLQANIGVIVNVLEDHMDVMGPTLSEVAEAFTNTIPYDGFLIIDRSPYESYFKEIAKKRRTKVIVANPEKVSEDYLLQFEYMVFPDNVALVLAVAEALQIDEEVALRGMLNANPDPGAMKILPIGNKYQPSYFVNGFAANDSASTLNIYKRVDMLGHYPSDHLVVIMNCREDRVDRTEQFATDVLPHLEMESLILIGKTVGPIMESYNQGHIKTKEIVDLEETSVEEITRVLQKYLSGYCIYGVGNIHGAGEPLITRLEEFKVFPEKEMSYTV